jgi:diaminohydroxyphosphoribosylaminopyrimidine deaminase / 5-amino-6-(5-phosphoribosylamino)uracil reductase
MSEAEHVNFMRRALVLAQNAWGMTAPNPMVGALIVERGKIVAEGWHAQDGGPHAEREVLKNLGRKPGSKATMYVTLEPCSTPGRTGACCDAIIAAGLKRVVIGATDPNPAHAGGGIEVLKAAGIEVTAGIEAQACTDLNLIFNHWITTESPLIAAKTAVTIDGRIATRTGDSQWITNEASRADVHRWRRLFPSIAVGAMTVLQDNPSLTSRQPDGEEWCPRRFVFDGLLRSVVDRNLPKIYTDQYRERTIVVTTPHGGLGYVRKLREEGVTVWVLPSADRRVNFDDFRAKCVEEKISGVYVEGGAQLISEMLRSRHLDYLFNYRAPVFFADEKARSALVGLRTERLAEAIRLADVKHATFGDDQLMRGRVVYPEKLQAEEGVFARP